MSQEKDKFREIPKEERLPELEEQVRYFMNITEDYPVNTILHKRVEVPSFKNDKEKFDWEMEEIRRCQEGYNGMCGKMYFFFNYCYIKNLSGGRIRPEFRVVDNEWFKLIEECEREGDWGIVCVKRRRVGASWKEAADVLHDCSFKPHYNIGMNSKTENDSIKLFQKVKFLYSNLPSFLRATSTAGNSKMSMFFAYNMKDEHGNKIIAGTQSQISVRSPTVSAFEGEMLNKWVCDEAGKIPELPQMWSFTEECLMQETRRLGVPILFGTAGEVGKDGRGLKEMWDGYKVFRLRRFFFGAWMGLVTDEHGNDRKEEAIRWVVYERYRRSSISDKLQSDFMQKYPLTVEEAFNDYSNAGLGDKQTILRQKQSLMDNPPRRKKGWFKRNTDGVVEFRPDNNGKCIIYEEPQKAFQNNYIAASDPADHDNALDEASDLSTYIMTKQVGLQAPRIVFEYTDRPKLLKEYYDQSILALEYYNNCKILIENNRYRMITYYQENNCKHKLYHTPQGMIRLIGGKSNTIGFRMTEASKEYMENLIEEYILEYCDEIPSRELLDEFGVYGSKNTDRVIAFGLCLVLLKEDRTKGRNAGKYQGSKYKMPVLRRDSTGKIVRVIQSSV